MSAANMRSRPTPAVDQIVRLVEHDPGHAALVYVDRFRTRRGYPSRRFGYAAFYRAVYAGRIEARPHSTKSWFQAWFPV